MDNLAENSISFVRYILNHAVIPESDKTQEKIRIGSPNTEKRIESLGIVE